MNYAVLVACSDQIDPADRIVAYWLDKQVEHIVSQTPRVVLIAPSATRSDEYVFKELAARDVRVYAYCPNNIRIEYAGYKRRGSARWEGRCADFAMVRDLKYAQGLGWEVYALTLIRRYGAYDDSLRPLERFLDWHQPLAGNPECFEDE